MSDYRSQIPLTELWRLGLYGPNHCTCLDECPEMGKGAFCVFCEAVEAYVAECEAKERDGCPALSYE